MTTKTVSHTADGKVSKPTPGPWRVDPQFPADVLAADGSDVATTDTPGGTGQKPNDEADANARLIAAAPTMLDALQTIKTWLAQTHTGEQYSLAYVVERLEAAIRQAEEGQ